MAAALAAGKPVTAESRLVVLLKQQQDPQLLLAGAMIAETLSDERLALTRYLAYGRAETQQTETLQRALAYVLQRDGYLEEFRKYVETFGATDRAWALGEQQWHYFVGHRDGERLLALADYLMRKWPDPVRVETVHQWLYSACDDYLFGREPRDRYWRAAVVAAKYLPASGGYLLNMIGAAQAALTDQQRRRVLARHGEDVGRSAARLSCRPFQLVWLRPQRQGRGVAAAVGTGLPERWNRSIRRARIRRTTTSSCC